MATLSTDVNQQSNHLLLEFTQGVDLDQPLAPFEIKTQLAWINELKKSKLLSDEEHQHVSEALHLAISQMQAGTFDWKIEDEDIHMNLERFICEKHGALGKKIHLGRSRNDLIATSLRLFCNEVFEKKIAALKKIIKTIMLQADQNLGVIVPGMTHLQFGQPIQFSQIILSHAQAFKRDIFKLELAQKLALLNMPLGSAAMSGTHLDIDLERMAAELGFASGPDNSYDSVGDRDFMFTGLQAFAGVAIHLSKLCEDIIIWSSQPFGWVKLPANWSTGSSIMPNKRNPDVAELIRGKSAQVIGAEQQAALLIKGLPSSYSTDLHELKRVFLVADTQLDLCLKVLPAFIEGLEVNKETTGQQLNSGHLLATEVANELTAKGTPFREAYQTVAAKVEKANSTGKQIHDSETGFTFTKAIADRNASGGTSEEQIKNQLEKLNLWLTT